MIKSLASRIRQYKRPTILSPVFVSIEVILECIIPLIMASLIDDMEKGISAQKIAIYAVVLIAMAMLSLFFGVSAGKAAATAGCGFAKNLRQDLFYKVQNFAFADIDRFSTSSLVTRLTTDVTNVQQAFQMLIRIAVRTPFMMVMSIVMAFTINAKMAVIFVIAVPILGGALIGIAKFVMPIFKRIFKQYDALNASVQENVAGIRVVKSFVREDYEQKKFSKASDDVRVSFTKVDKILALNSPIMMVCMNVTMTLVIFLGSQIVVTTNTGDLSTGQLSQLITYGVQILSSMMMLSMVFVMTTMASESANRIVEVLNHESKLKNPENGLTKVASGDIVFEDVSFKYSEKSEKYALSDINLTLKSGETLGIIGGTGSSKTSLIQLISRLYDVTEGRVLVGGKDVRQYDLTALRNEVAVVLQKNVLFSGSIKENLRWGDKNATDEELVRVCKLAQADEFIQNFPDKYDTHIERGGTNVSGGQKQRLCIARALLKKPKVLILDDSTSAVDTKTDSLIRAAFESEIPDTTKIIIAQRISSVEHADKIIVMDDGKIVEQGTHDELVKLGGIYAEVFETQTKGKEA
ncbi:MAG: ABC transporter ATP-binding protein [Lachnospiraceae bacterium]|nr:ABC transporter ATP-binding protein [Lachnospiraceae bacterium]